MIVTVKCMLAGTVLAGFAEIGHTLSGGAEGLVLVATAFAALAYLFSRARRAFRTIETLGELPERVSKLEEISSENQEHLAAIARDLGVQHRSVEPPAA